MVGPLKSSSTFSFKLNYCGILLPLQHFFDNCFCRSLFTRCLLHGFLLHLLTMSSSVESQSVNDKVMVMPPNKKFLTNYSTLCTRRSLLKIISTPLNLSTFTVLVHSLVVSFCTPFLFAKMSL